MNIRIIKSIGTLLLCLSSSGAYASSNQFDLICNGTITSEIVGDKPKYEYYSYHFRLDLDNNVYCISKSGESCGSVEGILYSNDHTIRFKKIDEINGNEIIKHDEFINRSTGVHFAAYISKYTDRTARMLSVVWEGSCEKYPFSGFPVFQKKF